MRKAPGIIALPALTVALLTGCTSHHTAPQARGTTRLPTAEEAAQPPTAKYVPCTAAQLTGRVGGIGLGGGQYTRNLILTNNSDRACTFTGGPREISGVRRDGRRVRLAPGASSGAGLLYGLVGPANLQPGQSAQTVIHTTTLCRRAVAG